MKYTSALVVPALFALTAPADELAFTPGEGMRVTKTFVVTVETTMDDMEMTMKGQEMPMPGEIENETTSTSSITVTDHFVALGGGRPTKLERTFDGLSAETAISVNNPMMGGAQEFETTSASELQGTTVVFTWNEEDEGYDVAFAEEHAEEDAKLLEDLDEDMDLRAFLPGRAVAENDTWEVDPNAVMNLLAPGGSLKLVSEGAPTGMDMGGDVDFAQQLGEIEGTCTATYRGTKVVGERTVGIIALAITVESSNDITELTMEAIEQAAKQEGAMDFDATVESADVDAEFELTGEILWDLESGHVSSLEVFGDTSSVIDTAMSITAMGEEMEIEQAIYMSGTIKVSLEITRE